MPNVKAPGAAIDSGYLVSNVGARVFQEMTEKLRTNFITKEEGIDG